MKKNIIQKNLKLLIVISFLLFANVSFCQSNKAIHEKLKQRFFCVNESTLETLFSHSWYLVAQRSNRNFLGRKTTTYKDSIHVFNFDSTSVERIFKGRAETDEFEFYSDLAIGLVHFTSIRTIERIRYSIVLIDTEYIVMDVFWYFPKKGKQNSFKQKRVDRFLLKKM